MPFLNEHSWFEINDRPLQSSAKTAAIFLDRDGVVIEERHYLRDPEEVEVFPGVAETIEAIGRLDVPVVLVTNQSGIGQGLFGWAEYNAVHQRMLDILKIARPFAAVYANAYQSTETEASWRKPNPGMILQAATDLNVCLESSVMVGDKLVDLQAAARAGVQHLVHVRTGHGARERPAVVRHFSQAALIDSLADVSLDYFRTS